MNANRTRLRIKKSWQYNPYRPLEPKNDTDRPRYTYKKVDINRPMQADVPRELKPVSPLVAADDSNNSTDNSKKKQKNQKKKNRAKHQPSSRASRTVTDNTKEKTSRTHTDANKELMSIRGKYAIKSYEIGCIRGNIKIGDVDQIVDRIQLAVSTLNKLRAIAEKVSAALIDHIVSTTEDTSVLDHLVEGSAGATGYWAALLRLIYNGNTNSRNAAIKEVVTLFGINYFKSFQFPKMAITQAIQQLAVDIDNQIGNQIVGRIEKLKERVIELAGEERRDFVTTQISILERMSTSKVGKWDSINNLLDPPHQWRIIPVTSSTESYVQLTEEALVDLLWDVE